MLAEYSQQTACMMFAVKCLRNVRSKNFAESSQQTVHGRTNLHMNRELLKVFSERSQQLFVECSLNVCGKCSQEGDFVCKGYF